MRIWFCRSNDIGGWLIRLLTFSHWNHVAIELHGVIYEAMAGQGVRILSPHDFAKRWAKSSVVDVSLLYPDQAQTFLKRQVGKPYDWGGVFAFPFRAAWHHPEKWFCSELAAEALRDGGAKPTFRLSPDRVTPRDLWAALP